MNKAIPLEDAIKFWEMKESILSALEGLLDDHYREYGTIIEEIENLVAKIESLGKKDGE
jgi:hypothetical protein